MGWGRRDAGARQRGIRGRLALEHIASVVVRREQRLDLFAHRGIVGTGVGEKADTIGRRT